MMTTEELATTRPVPNCSITAPIYCATLAGATRAEETRALVFWAFKPALPTPAAMRTPITRSSS